MIAKRYWPEIALGVTEFGVLLIGHFADPAQPLLYTLFILVLAAYIATRLVLNRNELEGQVAAIRANLDDFLSARGSVELIHEDEFYSRFRDACNGARRSVLTTNLDSDPPRRSGTSKGYFDNLVSMVRERPLVTFRRVERASPQKGNWILDLVRGLEGSENFTLFVLDDPIATGKLPHISAQVVDEDQVALVAVIEHNDPHGKRDIWIRGREFAPVWSHYHRHALSEGKHSRRLVYEGQVDRKILNDLAKKHGWRDA